VNEGEKRKVFRKRKKRARYIFVYEGGTGGQQKTKAAMKTGLEEKKLELRL